MGYIPTKKVLVASGFNPNGNYQLAKENSKAPHTHMYVKPPGWNNMEFHQASST